LGKSNTFLDEADYRFLSRFLDTTKANLFFARGVILVEGYSESILIPVIAEKIGKSLNKNSVSIVNVGSAAFLRFGKIFLRKDKIHLPIKVAVITDLDYRPSLFSVTKNKVKRRRVRVKDAFSEEEIQHTISKRTLRSENVNTFFSPYWTFEYCIALSPSLRKEFYRAVLLSWKEKKKTQGIKNTKAIDQILETIESQFSKWTEPNETIAFEIYNDIILKYQLSKTIIAQHFAEMIENDIVKIDPDEQNIKYIIDAIHFVTK